MRNKITLTIVSLLMLSSFSRLNPNVERVSIINLIANPEKYDNKAITVKGFYKHGFESTRLYFDKPSAVNKIYENSITIILDSTVTNEMMKIRDKSYVQIEGYFKKAPDNNINPFTDYIYKIYSVEEL